MCLFGRRFYLCAARFFRIAMACNNIQVLCTSVASINPLNSLSVHRVRVMRKRRGTTNLIWKYFPSVSFKFYYFFFAFKEFIIVIRKTFVRLNWLEDCVLQLQNGFVKNWVELNWKEKYASELKQWWNSNNIVQHKLQCAANKNKFVRRKEDLWFRIMKGYNNFRMLPARTAHTPQRNFLWTLK